MDELDELGRGIDFDHTENVSADTLYYVGLLFYKGPGVGPNYAEAAKWFGKVAGLQYRTSYYYGDNLSPKLNVRISSAQYYLGLMYWYGRGVKQDYAEAVKWFTKAAECVRHKEAEYFLGGAYYTGQGVQQDYAEAVKWYRKSAEKGNAEAQNIMGDACRDGKGVKQDCKEAVSWYQKAAEQGNAAAQNTLGDMYAGGLGVGKNLGEAMKWYMNAAQQGNADARSNLEKVIGTLPKENLVHR